MVHFVEFIGPVSRCATSLVLLGEHTNFEFQFSRQFFLYQKQFIQWIRGRSTPHFYLRNLNQEKYLRKMSRKIWIVNIPKSEILMRNQWNAVYASKVFNLISIDNETDPNVHNTQRFYVIRNTARVWELNSCEIDGYGENLCAHTQSNLNEYENEICWFNFFLFRRLFS